MYDDAIKEAKGLTPHQTSSSGELYAVSLKAVSNKSEKQQQQIPLMEYAEINNSASQSPQHHNLPSGYDAINDNNTNVNTEVSNYISILTTKSSQLSKISR